MKILVIGLGYVGSSAKRMFERKYDVETVDPNGEADYKEIPNKEYDLAVVCVPTESKDDGSCDTTIVENVVSEVKAEVILIKSAVIPKTTERLAKKYSKRIVTSPEYVGQSGYHSTYDFHFEMYKTPWWVLGGSDKDCEYVKDICMPIVGPQKKWYYVSQTEAEIVKYMENFYFAMKVIFAATFYKICEGYGANWEKVRQAWGADPRVDIMHTAVFKNNLGFEDSHCLRKDTKAIINAVLSDTDYNPQFLIDIVKNNKEFAKLNEQGEDTN